MTVGSVKTSSYLSILVLLVLLSYGIVTSAQFGLCSQRNKDPECRTFESLGYGIDPRATSIARHGGIISSLGIIPKVSTTSTADSTSTEALDQIPAAMPLSLGDEL